LESGAFYKIKFANGKSKTKIKMLFAGHIGLAPCPTFCQGAEQALGPAKADLSNMRSMLFQR